ncbi:MAG: DUF2846 domain-containing protein [Shewanella xiamenensis]|jgi:hypothetical protein|uniref:DUF2846 domain-containing protein n=1 Tax=Shewanella putrefaciens (strain 200) TaxID=399804 RepID=E6XKB0_SHEP2|nr:DUF2846 domain-containing protein [Shewanella xiamenensis]MCD8560085.1 DUF2846 domain-containing protein [Shewanella xiamenensis]
MKLIFAIFIVIVVTGCTVVPYEQLNLDTTSEFTVPEEGKSGIYVYQWKTGVVGALFDVDFEIKGFPEIALNTGEYAHFEVPPGEYEYKLSGGMFKQYIPVKFEQNKNYFFRAFLLNASDHAVLVRDQKEIDEAKKNISTKRYQPHDAD